MLLDDREEVLFPIDYRWKLCKAAYGVEFPANKLQISSYWDIVIRVLAKYPEKIEGKRQEKIRLKIRLPDVIPANGK